MQLVTFGRALLLVFCPCGATLLRATQAAAQQSVTWDHSKCTSTTAPAEAKCNPLFSVTAQPGEKITLTIQNTCTSDFDYSVISVPLAQPNALTAAGTSCSETKSIDIPHDPQYGGYIITIAKKANADDANGSARVTIAVTTSQWLSGFSGGFTLNGLKNPSFALRQDAPTSGSSSIGGTGAAATTYHIVEQTDAEDRLGRSVVSFVHVSHSAFAKFGVRPALTFGLGVEPDHGGDYYPGISFLLGDKAALTLGAAVGQVNTLPAGRQLNDQVTDANTLATLGHRRIGTWFAGISYQFLSGGADDFKKPFQGQGGAGAASGGNGGGGAAPPATTPAPPTVQITSGDKQTLGKSATSQPLEIASNAKGAVVTWALDPKLNFIDIGQHSDHTDANSGKATAVLTTAAGVADTTMRVRATVCDAQANCNNATYFTVKIRP